MITTSSMTVTEAEALAARYGAAWNDHDVDALLSMQDPGMTFRLRVEGSEPATGADTLRDLFSFFFAVLPDYRAEIRRTMIQEGLIVLEYTITATLAGEFPIGGEVGRPTGRPMSVDAVDILPCANGKITGKETYVDGFAFRRGLGL